MATKKPEKKVNTKASSGAKKTPTKKPEVKKTTETTSVKKKKQPTLTEILKKNSKLSEFYTNDGHRLTICEAKFIDEYVSHGNQRQAVIKAGYTKNEETASQLGNKILRKEYIQNEINFRLQEHRKSTIADRDEIMQFFSDMMRGKILDQFDMPATNADKIKAGIELAKRSVDIEDRLREKSQATVPEIKISLDWGGANGQEN